MSHMKSITPYFPTPPNKFQLNWFSFFWPFFHNTQLRHVCDFNYHTPKTTTYDKCIAPFTTHTKKQFWVPKSEMQESRVCNKHCTIHNRRGFNIFISRFLKMFSVIELEFYCPMEL